MSISHLMPYAIWYIAFGGAVWMFVRTFSLWFDVYNTLSRLGYQHQGFYESYFGIVEAEWPNRDKLPEPLRTDFVQAVTVYADMTARARALNKCYAEVGGRMQIAAPLIIGLLLAMCFLTADFLVGSYAAYALGAASILAFVVGIAKNLRVSHKLSVEPVRLDASVFNEGAERLCLQGLIPEEETTAYDLTRSVYLNMNHVGHSLHNVLSSMGKI